ncbi:MAG: hypothetical protein E5Y74_01710 [Mesorhizobium sp.]|nr:MAG: hypothetical protein E5Y74_01710 [Mesorhizobium sp.]
MPTVTSASYNPSGYINAIIDGVEMCVPDDLANMDRHAIAEWEADGGTIAAYLEPRSPIPDRVSPAQAEIALYNVDNGALLASVNAIVEAFPYEPVRIWWRKATYISRDHAYLQALALEVALTDDEVDGLFVAAAKI